MKAIMSCLFLIATTTFVPAYARDGEDPIASLAQELNLTEVQREHMRETFKQFLQKQSQVPMPGQVALQNKAMLKDIITSPNFDKSKAQMFVGGITAVITEATVNRLERATTSINSSTVSSKSNTSRSCRRGSPISCNENDRQMVDLRRGNAYHSHNRSVRPPICS